MINKRQKRLKRHKRVRSRVYGIGDRPRVSVSRSNKYINAQIINDDTHKTIVSMSDVPSKIIKKNVKGNKIERAIWVGEELAKKAKKQGITKIVYDRGGYRYHGRIKALAEALRKGGLIF